MDSAEKLAIADVVGRGGGVARRGGGARWLPNRSSSMRTHAKARQQAPNNALARWRA